MDKAKGQKGFVSIFSAIIIMTVLSLVAIGFSYATRSAERRTLDDQLNTQAYYAAESGINAAITNLGSPQLSSTDCSNLNGDYDPDNDAEFTCVIVDEEPTIQNFSNIPVVGTGEPQIANVETSGTARLTFKFDDSTDTSGTSFRNTGLDGSGNATFPRYNSWGNNVGVLRLDIVPTGNFSRASLQNHYTVFLYPTTSGGVATANITRGQGAGTTVPVSCPGAGLRCEIELRLSSSYPRLMVRMQSLYRPTQASLTPLDSAGTVLRMQNGQILVDSTGRAGDVFRRIQAFVPVNGNGGYSVVDDAVGTTQAICKRYQAVPGNTTISNPAVSESIGGYCSFN